MLMNCKISIWNSVCLAQYLGLCSLASSHR